MKFYVKGNKMSAHKSSLVREGFRGGFSRTEKTFAPGGEILGVQNFNLYVTTILQQYIYIYIYIYIYKVEAAVGSKYRQKWEILYIFFLYLGHHSLKIRINRPDLINYNVFFYVLCSNLFVFYRMSR